MRLIPHGLHADAASQQAEGFQEHIRTRDQLHVMGGKVVEVELCPYVHEVVVNEQGEEPRGITENDHDRNSSSR